MEKSSSQKLMVGRENGLKGDDTISAFPEDNLTE
jgi:hypothetical protein